MERRADGSTVSLIGELGTSVSVQEVAVAASWTIPIDEKPFDPNSGTYRRPPTAVGSCNAVAPAYDQLE